MEDFLDHAEEDSPKDYKRFFMETYPTHLFRTKLDDGEESKLESAIRNRNLAVYSERFGRNLDLWTGEPL